MWRRACRTRTEASTSSRAGGHRRVAAQLPSALRPRPQPARGARLGRRLRRRGRRAVGAGVRAASSGQRGRRVGCTGPAAGTGDAEVHAHLIPGFTPRPTTPATQRDPGPHDPRDHAQVDDTRRRRSRNPRSPDSRVRTQARHRHRRTSDPGSPDPGSHAEANPNHDSISDPKPQPPSGEWINEEGDICDDCRATTRTGTSPSDGPRRLTITLSYSARHRFSTMAGRGGASDNAPPRDFASVKLCCGRPWSRGCQCCRARRWCPCCHSRQKHP